MSAPAPVKLAGWGNPRRSPALRWATFVGRSAYVGSAPHWIDHPYRLRRSDGTVAYVAEPYDVSEQDLEDLLALHAEGWSISIDGCGKHHENTIRIVLERRDG